MDQTYRSTTYETQPAPQPTFGLQKDYLKTLPSILKIGQFVLAFLTFLCASIWGFPGQGWVTFVSMSAFITTLIYWLMYLFGIYGRLPGPRSFIEFIYYCIFTFFFLIAAIVAAANAGYAPAIGAATFFGFAATIIYGVDTFFQFRTWRSGTAEAQAPASHVPTSPGMEQGPTY